MSNIVTLSSIKNRKALAKRAKVDKELKALENNARKSKFYTDKLQKDMKDQATRMEASFSRIESLLNSTIYCDPVVKKNATSLRIKKVIFCVFIFLGTVFSAIYLRTPFIILKK